MFHSGFAAPQCLSFWYPSSTDYSRKQKYQYIKKKLYVIIASWSATFCFGDILLGPFTTDCTYGSVKFHGLWPETFLSWLLRPSWSSDSSTKENVLQAICLLARKQQAVELFWCVECSVGLNSHMLDICSEIGFALTHVSKWTMGQCVLNKILFLSPDIIEWRKLQDLKKEQSSWSATYCK